MVAQSTDTPTLPDVLRLAFESMLGEVRGAIPAKVLSYDATQQRATIQATISYRNADDTYTQYQPVANVPVLWMSAGNASLTMPLSAGDVGMIIVAERALDEWKTTKVDPAQPADPRRFDQTDALFFPGGRSFQDALPGDAIDAVATVLRALQLKLGDSGANQPVILGDLFFTQLGAFVADIGVFGGEVASAGALLAVTTGPDLLADVIAAGVIFSDAGADLVASAATFSAELTAGLAKSNTVFVK